MRLQLNRWWTRLAALITATLASVSARAVVLPEDRADTMYHYYNGGGTKVDGPALLVRKGFAEKTSVYASYYADAVSGASIDVVTTASKYKETRQEYGTGIDYLYRNTTMGLSFTTSDERDYKANTTGISVAHEIFDGLTTINLGYIVGHDEVGKTNTDFHDSVDRYHYKLGASQIFTPTFLMSVDYEAVLESGFLNSPYRAARLQGLLVPERYPRTRDSYAVAVRAIKGVLTPEGRVGSSLVLGYRYFWDTWNITAHTLEVSVRTHYTAQATLEPHFRYYRQSAASFYSDNFESELTFMARDKELSTFQSYTAGVKAGYDLAEHRLGFSRATLSVAYDFLHFTYDDFTDIRNGRPYAFNANVLQVFLSGWF
jgi:uncharacterized protein DUF3570